MVNSLKNDSVESNSSDTRLINSDSIKVDIEEICDKYNMAYNDGCGGFGDAIAKVVDLQPTDKTIESLRNNQLKRPAKTDGIRFCNSCEL